MVIRALCLASFLLKDNEQQCETFVQHNGVKFLLPHLASANETVRVEASRVLSYVAKQQVLTGFILRDNLLIRLIVLIEEGI